MDNIQVDIVQQIDEVSIEVSALNGREVELRDNSGNVEWRYVGDPTWNFLYHKTDVINFNDLSDVPQSYTGQENKVVTVKPDATGLEFTNPRGSFITLTDAPASYVGQAKKIVSVNEAATGLEFIEMLSDAERSSTGLVSGGTIIPQGGILFQVTTGIGYIVDHTTETTHRVAWATQSSISTIGDGVNYFCIDTTGTARVFLTVPDKNLYLYLGAAVATQENTVIIDVQNNPSWVGDFQDRVSEFAGSAIKTIIEEGLEVSEQALHKLKIHVESGYISTRLNRVHIVPDDTLIKVFATSDYGFVPDTNNFYSPQDTVNTTYWNDITKPYGQSMIEMTAGYWKKDLIAIFPNGNIFYVYGQQEFLTSVLARSAPIQTIPSSVSVAAVYLAFIVCRKNDTTIAERIIDIRPNFPRVWGQLGDDADTRPANASINLMSTGLLNGGLLTINVSDPTKFDLSAGNALLVDNTDILNPTYTTINWDNFTGIENPYLTTEDTIYININSAGEIEFHTAELTAEQRRDYVEIGWLDHPGRTYIEFAKTEPFYNAGIQSQLNDFIESYSPYNIYGNEYTAATGLTIKRSEGSIFDGNSNYSNNTKSPHIITTSTEEPCTINYYHRNGLTGWVNNLPQVTNIDPHNYDKNGVLTTVPTNYWTIQVIFYYPIYESNDIQYGQEAYSTYQEALSRLYALIELNPYNSADVFRTWLIVKQGATDLTNTSEAVFFTAGRLRLNEVIGGIENNQPTIETHSTGQVLGGYITPTGGITFTVSAGNGYITNSTNFNTRVTWEETTGLSTVVDGRNFIMVDIDGNVFCSSIVDNYYNYIQVGVMFTGGGNTQIVEIINSPRSIRDFPQRVLRYQQIAMKAIIGDGCEVTERATPNLLELSIADGTIFINMNEHILGNTSTFTRMYLTSSHGWVPYLALPLNKIVPSIYNDITKPYGSALVTMTDTYWKKDLIFRTSSGNVFVICGQAEYATKDLALNAPLPSVPGQLGAVAAYLCVVVCQKEDTSISDRIIDIRPFFDRLFQDTSNINKVPTGGLTGQRLTKIDNTDFNVTWETDSPAGNNQELQFNDNGIEGASSNLKYDKVNKTLMFNGAPSLNNTPISVLDSIDSNAKILIRNTYSGGVDASAEFMSMSDDEESFTAVGSNNSSYSDPLETLWKANDSYLSAGGGDLTIGTESPNKNIILYTGGVQSTNIRGEVTSSGINLVTGNAFMVNGFNLMNMITTAANASEEAIAFAAGSKIVIRTDLL